VDIFLHEGLPKRAMRVAEAVDAYHRPLVHRVMDAVLAAHPEWVLAQAKARAEAIMDAGKSQDYGEAAEWLKRARAAYDRLDDMEAWTLYLETLKAKHARRYRLLEHLRGLD
jgi:uncharacterized Zn finger protein